MTEDCRASKANPHQSDAVLRRVMVDKAGFSHAITGCKWCGIDLSSPMPNGQLPRWLKQQEAGR